MTSGKNRGGRRARRENLALRCLCSLRFVLAVVFWPALAQAQPTFTKDIAPIVWTRCASCHRPGEIAPFSLITYADVRHHLTQIADVTTRRIMPPWKPVAGKGDFQNARRLSDRELDLLQRWIASGAPEGDASALPPAPTGAGG